MSKHECFIGMMGTNAGEALVTFEDLEEVIANRIRFNDYCKEDGLPIEVKVWTMKEYCDRRRSTDVTRFNFCPMCGKKIDWKSVREEIHERKV